MSEARRGLRPQGDLLRLGRHVVAGREAVLLAEQLADLEDHLARRAARDSPADRGVQDLCRAAQARVARDLELLTAALEHSHLPAH